MTSTNSNYKITKTKMVQRGKGITRKKEEEKKGK